VLGVEVEVELVQVINTSAELLPALVIRTQQVFVARLPYLKISQLGKKPLTRKNVNDTLMDR
jgi:hypothetical protein